MLQHSVKGHYYIEKENRTPNLKGHANIEIQRIFETRTLKEHKTCKCFRDIHNRKFKDLR